MKSNHLPRRLGIATYIGGKHERGARATTIDRKDPARRLAPRTGVTAINCNRAYACDVT